jgi:hypothetical protein
MSRLNRAEGSLSRSILSAAIAGDLEIPVFIVVLKCIPADLAMSTPVTNLMMHTMITKETTALKGTNTDGTDRLKNAENSGITGSIGSTTGTEPTEETHAADRTMIACVSKP